MRVSAEDTGARTYTPTPESQVSSVGSAWTFLDTPCQAGPLITALADDLHAWDPVFSQERISLSHCLSWLELRMHPNNDDALHLDLCLMGMMGH